MKLKQVNADELKKISEDLQDFLKHNPNVSIFEILDITHEERMKLINIEQGKEIGISTYRSNPPLENISTHIAATEPNARFKVISFLALL